MKEINKHLLDKALEKLSEHSPKAFVWDRIEEGLVVAEQESYLQQSLTKLPNYDPPTQVWENIESGLSIKPETKVRVFNLRRWAAVAAIFIAVTWAGLYLYNTDQNATYVSVNYSEEQVASAFLDIDWEADEDAFEMVSAFCKTDNIVCKQPAFKILTEELDELNAARDELKYAMDQYGKDPELIAQLTVIEHERTDILKKIIKQI